MHKRIQSARTQASLSQKELARLVGISNSAVSHWESADNAAMPTFEHLIKVADITGVETEWLATGRSVAHHNSFRKNDEVDKSDVMMVVLNQDKQQWMRIYREIPAANRPLLMDFLKSAFGGFD